MSIDPSDELSRSDRLPPRPPAQPSRRVFLRKGWTWLCLLLPAVFGYPLFAFLGHHLPKKKQQIRVPRSVPPGGLLAERDFIIFESEQGPWAVSRRCTHLGCRVNFSEREGVLLCPCHQSRYTTRGRLLKGPARMDLPLYRVERMTGNERGYVVTI